jgi:hypothetical protein
LDGTTNERSTAISNGINSIGTTIDIGKNAFHIVGLDQRGAIVLRQRWSCGQVEARLAKNAAVPTRDGGLCWRPPPEPPTAIARSRCTLDAREIHAALFQRAEERLSLRGSDRGSAAPANEIRSHQDGRATRVASAAPSGERLVSQRTGIINQIRAFLLERGTAARQGLRFLRAELPIILATRSHVGSPRMLRVIEELAGDWRRLDERIARLSQEIEDLVRQDPAYERLMTVPGIGPIISSAMVAAIGNGAVFTKGRDFGAWLGLVPKQISSGDAPSWARYAVRQSLYRRRIKPRCCSRRRLLQITRRYPPPWPDAYA